MPQGGGGRGAEDARMANNPPRLAAPPGSGGGVSTRGTGTRIPGLPTAFTTPLPVPSPPTVAKKPSAKGKAKGKAKARGQDKKKLAADEVARKARLAAEASAAAVRAAAAVAAAAQLSLKTPASVDSLPPAPQPAMQPQPPQQQAHMVAAHPRAAKGPALLAYDPRQGPQQALPARPPQAQQQPSPNLPVAQAQMQLQQQHQQAEIRRQQQQRQQQHHSLSQLPQQQQQRQHHQLEGGAMPPQWPAQHPAAAAAAPQEPSRQPPRQGLYYPSERHHDKRQGELSRHDQQQDAAMFQPPRQFLPPRQRLVRQPCRTPSQRPPQQGSDVIVLDDDDDDDDEEKFADADDDNEELKEKGETPSGLPFYQQGGGPAPRPLPHQQQHPPPRAPPLASANGAQQQVVPPHLMTKREKERHLKARRKAYWPDAAPTHRDHPAANTLTQGAKPKEKREAYYKAIREGRVPLPPRPGVDNAKASTTGPGVGNNATSSRNDGTAPSLPLPKRSLPLCTPTQQSGIDERPPSAATSVGSPEADLFPRLPLGKSRDENGVIPTVAPPVPTRQQTGHCGTAAPASAIATVADAVKQNGAKKKKPDNWKVGLTVEEDDNTKNAKKTEAKKKVPKENVTVLPPSEQQLRLPSAVTGLAGKGAVVRDGLPPSLGMTSAGKSGGMPGGTVSHKPAQPVDHSSPGVPPVIAPPAPNIDIKGKGTVAENGTGGILTYPSQSPLAAGPLPPEMQGAAAILVGGQGAAPPEKKKKKTTSKTKRADSSSGKDKMAATGEDTPTRKKRKYTKRKNLSSPSRATVPLAAGVGVPNPSTRIMTLPSAVSSQAEKKSLSLLHAAVGHSCLDSSRAPGQAMSDGTGSSRNLKPKSVGRTAPDIEGGPVGPSDKLDSTGSQKPQEAGTIDDDKAATEQVGMGSARSTSEARKPSSDPVKIDMGFAVPSTLEEIVLRASSLVATEIRSGAWACALVSHTKDSVATAVGQPTRNNVDRRVANGEDFTIERDKNTSQWSQGINRNQSHMQAMPMEVLSSSTALPLVGTENVKPRVECDQDNSRESVESGSKTGCSPVVGAKPLTGVNVSSVVESEVASNKSDDGAARTMRKSGQESSPVEGNDPLRALRGEVSNVAAATDTNETNSAVQKVLKPTAKVDIEMVSKQSVTNEGGTQEPYGATNPKGAVRTAIVIQTEKEMEDSTPSATRSENDVCRNKETSKTEKEACIGSKLLDTVTILADAISPKPTNKETAERESETVGSNGLETSSLLRHASESPKEAPNAQRNGHPSLSENRENGFTAPQKGRNRPRHNQEAVLHAAASAIERFALEIVLPSLLSAGVGENKDGGGNPSHGHRVYMATLLALREVLCINAESIFFCDGESPSYHHCEKEVCAEQLGARAGTELLPGEARRIIRNNREEKAFRSQLLATGVILSAIQRLDPEVSSVLSSYFLDTVEKYDMADEEFTSCLERADGRSKCVTPDGRVMGREENVAWRVSFNRAREAHPLIRTHERLEAQSRKAYRDAIEAGQPLRWHDVHKQKLVRRVMVPNPNACAAYVVEKVLISPMRDREERAEEERILHEDRQALKEYRRQLALRRSRKDNKAGAQTLGETMTHRTDLAQGNPLRSAAEGAQKQPDMIDMTIDHTSAQMGLVSSPSQLFGRGQQGHLERQDSGVYSDFSV